ALSQSVLSLSTLELTKRTYTLLQLTYMCVYILSGTESVSIVTEYTGADKED
ncbi:hypothetical protein J6590_081838, partial [Homalodisca vitripennis]